MTASRPFHEHANSFDLPLTADPARAWVALTAEISTWWSPDMTAAGGRMTLEPEIGGRLMESTEDGGGVLWATVALVVPGRRLELFGELAPNFGGPARTWHAYDIAPGEGGGSVLTFSDHVWGAISPDLGPTLLQGWKGILAGLQQHLGG